LFTIRTRENSLLAKASCVGTAYLPVRKAKLFIMQYNAEMFNIQDSFAEATYCLPKRMYKHAFTKSNLWGCPDLIKAKKLLLILWMIDQSSIISEGIYLSIPPAIQPFIEGIIS